MTHLADEPPGEEEHAAFTAWAEEQDLPADVETRDAWDRWKAEIEEAATERAVEEWIERQEARREERRTEWE